MTRFQSVTAAAAVGLLLVTGAVFAQGRDRGPGRGPRGVGGLGLPVRELNLTETQRQQIDDIRTRHREATQAAAKEWRTALEAQRKAVEAVPADEALIRSTSQAVADAQTELALQQARVHSEVWAVLTPAQQDQAKRLRAERQARMEQRRQQIQQRRQQNQQQRG